MELFTNQRGAKERRANQIARSGSRKSLSRCRCSVLLSGASCRPFPFPRISSPFEGSTSPRGACLPPPPQHPPGYRSSGTARREPREGGAGRWGACGRHFVGLRDSVRAAQTMEAAASPAGAVPVTGRPFSGETRSSLCAKAVLNS